MFWDFAHGNPYTNNQESPLGKEVDPGSRSDTHSSSRENTQRTNTGG